VVRPVTLDLDRGITSHGVFAPDYYGTDKLDQLRQLVERGAVTLRVAQTFQPEEAPKPTAGSKREVSGDD
jgi:hypothetical protein